MDTKVALHNFGNATEKVKLSVRNLNFYYSSFHALKNINLDIPENKVTAFTASDFGRTFTSNGDGTDHGWGAHHFVMGGAVNGGDIYGNFPVLGAKNANNNNFDSSPNQLGNGSLIPETAVDQLGATLAKWFGVSGTDALTVFPNLANFTTRDLGFMKPG